MPRNESDIAQPDNDETEANADELAGPEVESEVEFDSSDWCDYNDEDEGDE